MKEKVTSGFVIAEKADESEPDILVDKLHPCMCPNCGISNFDEGHEKDIIYDDFDYGCITTRCWGGFGEERYRYIPHKCKACGTVFAPWTVEKKINGNVIGYFIGLVFVVAVAIFAFTAAITDKEPMLLLITILMLLFMVGCIEGIDEDTWDVCDPEKLIIDNLKDAEITGEYLDEEDAEEETEDLDDTFDVSMQQAVSACKELATANMFEPKSAMEVFGTLTPEQKAVAHYLMGGAVMASEEEILAMQHIQDQVQANTAKRMDDIWRLHI